MLPTPNDIKSNSSLLISNTKSATLAQLQKPTNAHLNQSAENETDLNFQCKLMGQWSDDHYTKCAQGIKVEFKFKKKGSDK